ncbi:MAG: 30S ribosomal protein THX [Bacteroidetes bacterium]|nr:30S ribosomal protein THX [Bacteroidota bacterium]
MGKGDIRTRRGKVWRGTYGVTRPRRWKTTTPVRVAKPRKVKALKDLPKTVEVQPINKIVPKEHIQVVEAVQHRHQEPQVHVVETKPEPAEVKAPVVAEEHKPVVETPVAETHEVETAAVETHEVETPAHHTEEKTAKKKAKAPVKKASKPAAKKAPAAKKPAAAKKAPAKKNK